MNQFVRKRPDPVCFRQWANKSYAAFNSLNRCVKIGVLCFSYTMLVAPKRCMAQADSTQMNRIDLEEVEVTADASPNVFSPTGRAITDRKSTRLNSSH